MARTEQEDMERLDELRQERKKLHLKLIRSLKIRPGLPVHRSVLHVVNLVFHLASILSLHEVPQTQKECITIWDHQKMSKFLAMRFRHFTIWVVMLNILYSASALVLDVCRGIRKGPIPCQPKFAVEVFFRGIPWPTALVVIFWLLFNYCSKDLIFPGFGNLVVNPTYSHILHIWIAIFLVLEMLVRPRNRPLTFTPNLRIIFTVLALFMILIYYTLFSEDTCL